MHRQLLILDIDETLVYATETPLERPPDFRVGPFVAYRRPHLHKFIETVLGWFDVAVWSSSTADYAAIVTANVFPTSAAPKFVWARERFSVVLMQGTAVALDRLGVVFSVELCGANEAPCENGRSVRMSFAKGRVIECVSLGKKVKAPMHGWNVEVVVNAVSNDETVSVPAPEFPAETETSVQTAAKGTWRLFSRANRQR